MSKFKTLPAVLCIATVFAFTFTLSANENQQPCCGGVDEKETDSVTVTCYLYTKNSVGMTYLFNADGVDEECGDAVSNARQNAEEDMDDLNAGLPEQYRFQIEDTTYTCGSCENNGCPPESDRKDVSRTWRATIVVKCSGPTQTIRRDFKSRESAWVLSGAIARKVCNKDELGNPDRLHVIIKRK